MTWFRHRNLGGLVSVLALVVTGCHLFRDADSVQLQPTNCESASCPCRDATGSSSCADGASSPPDSTSPDSTTMNPDGFVGPDGDATDSSSMQDHRVDCPAKTVPTIQTADLEFQNGRLAVTPGTVIKFQNNKDATHAPRNGLPGDNIPDGTYFKIEKLGKNQKVCLKFDRTDNFPYHCANHPREMRGAIVVRQEVPRDVACAQHEPAQTVKIEDREFKGGTVEIQPGEVVEWVNRDDEEHRVVSGQSEEDPIYGALFDSGIMEKSETMQEDASYCVQFPKGFPEGVYQYFSIERSAEKMSGKVRVQ